MVYFPENHIKGYKQKKVFLPVKVRSWSTSKIIFVSQAKFGALLFIFLTRKKNTIYSENFRSDPNSKFFSGSNQSLHFKFGLGMIISFHSFSNCQKEVTLYSRDPYAVSF